MRPLRWILICTAALLCAFGSRSAQDFDALLKAFIAGYRELDVQHAPYDYREYFSVIRDEAALARQAEFFTRQKDAQQAIDRGLLSQEDQLRFDHLRYETDFNLERIRLERQWVRDGRHLPASGLYGLKDREAWYALFAKRFTSLDLDAKEVEAMGRREVVRVKREIASLQRQTGFRDSAAFYAHMQDSSFYIRDKAALWREFARIDSTVRQHLPAFIGTADVPPVYPMEWPEATAFTPPGMYLNRRHNAFGRDVFQINFYDRRFNRRAAEWIYLHEAIPGHHLQMTLRPESELQRLFQYPGNFEGWACYVEYFGKDLGLYRDRYAELGKWEWDLVRSARLVLDAGIHSRGWTRQQALDYWMATIPGQTSIAEREVTRVTNWPGQALSYKAGAASIMKMKAAWLKRHPQKKAADFHKWYLQMGNMPLELMEHHLSPLRGE